MKIYALQVDPEIQESPLFFDEEFFPENINVFGNRYFNAHCMDVFNCVREVLYSGDLLDEWDKLNSGGRGWYSSWKEALEDLLPPEGREPYTREERKTRIPELLERFHSCRTREEESVICEVLGVVTGKAWSHKTIRGCCQGDWQNVIYASDDWTPEQLSAFETEYFNTGSEWIICEEEPELGERFEQQVFNSREALLKVYERAGTLCDNLRRLELQGQPRLEGLYGPMYDGEENGAAVIRYESPEVYKILST